MVAVAELGAAADEGDTDLRSLRREFSSLLANARGGGAPVEIREIGRRIETDEETAAEDVAAAIMDGAAPGHVLLWGDVATTAGAEAFRLRLTQPRSRAGGILGKGATLELPPLGPSDRGGLPAFLQGIAFVHQARWKDALRIYGEVPGDALRGALAPVLFDPRHMAEWSPDEIADAVSISGAAARAVAEEDRSATALAIRSASAQSLLALGERLQGQACLEPLNNSGMIFSSVLEQMSPTRDPDEWTANYIGMGTAMLRLGQRGEGSTSIRYLSASTVAFRQALRVLSSEATPNGWADAQFRLGLAFLALGQRTPEAQAIGHLRRAIQAFQAVMSVETRQEAPQTWAAAQANLGEAYTGLGNQVSGTEAQQHFFSATLAFSQALEVYTRETSAHAWARTNENLGIAYASLGENLDGPESVEHLNASLAALRRVLEVVTKQSDASLWAATQSNLARVYTVLASRAGPAESAEYLRKALEAYEQALTVFSRSSQARAWATVQHNYGIGLLRLAEMTTDGTELSMLERAAAVLREALELRTRESMPDEWVVSQWTLGDILTLHGQRAEEEEAQAHLRGAVEAYSLAREATRPEEDPADFARLLLALATAQTYLAEVAPDRDEARGLLEQAASALASAMESISGEGRPLLEERIAEQMQAVQQQRGLTAG